MIRTAKAYQLEKGSEIALESGLVLRAPELSYRVAAEVVNLLNRCMATKEVDALSMTIATALGRIGSSLYEAPEWVQVRRKATK